MNELLTYCAHKPLCVALLLFIGGAAVKAGVQEGDRIIKVSTAINFRAELASLTSVAKLLLFLS